MLGFLPGGSASVAVAGADPLVTAREVVLGVPGRIWLALGIVLLGVILGYLVNVVNRRLLQRAGVPESIEGTAFERTARSLDTSTVDIVGQLSMYFVVGLSVLVALSVAEIGVLTAFWGEVSLFLPGLFVAILIVLVGLVVGDKIEIVVRDRLSGIKLPQVGVLPVLAKYSVFYVALLIALATIEVPTSALLVLLGGYVFGVVFLGGIAFKDMLASGAAGMYLLLNQPYSIGDQVEVGGQRGIVQEVDVFVTHVESEGEEYIVPNRKVFENGIVRVRN
jgi:small-conductance mechanosensitive channel